MNAQIFLLGYLIPCTISLMVLWLCYRLLFNNSNRFQFNRFYLLSAMLFALALPLFGTIFSFSSGIADRFQPQWFSNIFLLNEITITPNGTSPIDQVTVSNITGPTNSSFSLWKILGIIYLTGVIVNLILFSIKLLKITVLTIRSPKEKREGYTAVFTHYDNNDFSFLNYAYFPDKNISSDIVRHELSHITHHHSIDILFTELMITLQWFNPFIYLYKKDLQLLHEYTADHEVLHDGADKEKYMYLILQQCTAVNFSNMSNNFNLLFTKKRIKMMSSNEKSKGLWLKLLAIVPVLALLLIANPKIKAEENISNTANTAENVILNTNAEEVVPQIDMNEPSENLQAEQTEISSVSKPVMHKELLPDDSVYNNIEVMPEFPGGMEAMMKYLSENIKYPEQAKEKNTQGRVLVSFVVEKDGSISNVKVARGIGNGCDEEAVRVISAMPKWKPGKHNGKKVRVSFAIPISFKLQ